MQKHILAPTMEFCEETLQVYYSILWILDKWSLNQTSCSFKCLIPTVNGLFHIDFWKCVIKCHCTALTEFVSLNSIKYLINRICRYFALLLNIYTFLVLVECETEPMSSFLTIIKLDRGLFVFFFTQVCHFRSFLPLWWKFLTFTTT